MNGYYTDYSEYMSRFFPGRKVQKISVNIGTGCPNRDGTIGFGGCIYCNNSSFTPSYCFKGGSVTEQMESGKKFFRKKYPDMKFLAYFQSYTGTHGITADKLETLMREALDTENTVGLIIGTRPDCLPDDIIAMLCKLNSEAPVFVELGIETLHDDTLRLINRGHDAACSIDTIKKLSARGLHVGVHLIAGLPGESEEITLDTVKQICNLPVESIKMHHLQVLRGTTLEKLHTEKKIEIPALTLDQYIDLCVRIIEIVPRTIAIERFLASSPPALVVKPKWGLKNYEFTNLLLNKLKHK